MNKTFLFARAALLALCALPAAQAAIPVQQWQQPSGAKVFLIESPVLPMVDVQIDFDAGSRRDPQGQAGLANAAAGMTAGGIAARDGRPALDEHQLNEAWADLGADFDGGASADRMSFKLRSLTYPDLLSKAVALAARQIGEPSFPNDVWVRDRDRAAAAIREADTRPSTVAEHAYAHAVYGGHPYGWEPTEESLARINVDDLKAFYARGVQACRATVSIVGAVNRSQADALATQLLARLPATATCEPLPAVAEVPPLAKAEQTDVPFAAAQAQVFIGQPGIKRSDPDFFPLTVGNYILGGGGFVSRLTDEVREKRGLSYSVYSYFSPGLHAGAFTIGLQTRPDQTAQAISVAREVLARFVAAGPTEDELKAAKGNLVGGFALRIDTNRKLLDNLANIAWNKLPLDYLDTWTQKVGQVSTADIKAAFARALQPQRMVTVTVGAAAAKAP